MNYLLTLKNNNHISSKSLAFVFFFSMSIILFSISLWDYAIFLLFFSGIILFIGHNTRIASRTLLWISFLFFIELVTLLFSSIQAISFIAIKASLFSLLVAALTNISIQKKIINPEYVFWFVLTLSLIVAFKLLWDHNRYIMRMLSLGVTNFTHFRQLLTPFNMNVNISATLLIPGLVFSIFMYFESKKWETILFSGAAFAILKSHYL